MMMASCDPKKRLLSVHNFIFHASFLTLNIGLVIQKSCKLSTNVTIQCLATVLVCLDYWPLDDKGGCCSSLPFFPKGLNFIISGSYICACSYDI